MSISAASAIPALAQKVRRMLLMVWAVCLVFATMLIAFLETRSQEAELRRDLRSSAEIIQRFVRLHLQECRSLVAEELELDRSDGRLPSLIRSFHGHLGRGLFYLVDSRMRIRAIGAQKEGYLGLDLSGVPFLRDKPLYSPVHQSLFGERAVITMTFPLPSGDLLALEYPVDELKTILNAIGPTVPARRAALLVTDDKGTLVYHPDDELVRSRVNFQAELHGQPLASGGRLTAVSWRGRRYLAYRLPTQVPPGWGIYGLVETSVLTRSILERVVIQGLMLSAVLLALVVLLRWLLDREISLPLYRLSRRLENLDVDAPATDLQQTAQQAGSKELQVISRSLALLMARVQESHRILGEQEELFRTLSEFSSEWIFWRLPDGSLRYCSPSCAELTGYTSEDFYRDPDLMERIVHPEDRHFCVGHFVDDPAHREPGGEAAPMEVESG